MAEIGNANIILVYNTTYQVISLNRCGLASKSMTTKEKALLAKSKEGAHAYRNLAILLGQSEE